MTPEIIDREEFLVIGIRSVLEPGAYGSGSLWRDKFLPRSGEISGIDNYYYGVFGSLSESLEGIRYEYVAGIAAESLENVPAGMVGWVVPAGSYAEATAAGLQETASLYRAIIADWLPDSGYLKVDGPIFAYTDSRQPDSPDALWKLDIPVATPETLNQLDKWLA